MDEVRQGLQYIFQTDSPYTLCISGTGHAGMEAALVNLLEPGETVLVGNKGIWGARAADMAERLGANVVEIKVEAGKSFSYEQLKGAVEQHKPAVLFLCQGDSSTGVHQSLAGLGDLCHANGTLLLVDTVCSLGGVPFFADAWGIDAIYTGSQKCLSAPPGAAPLFLSDRALAKVRGRKTKVRSYYLDLNLVGDYWGWYNSRSYHHTGMVSAGWVLRCHNQGRGCTGGLEAAMHEGDASLHSALLWVCSWLPGLCQKRRPLLKLAPGFPGARY